MGYTAADKEFYMTESDIAFVRPGYEFEIVEFIIPDDRQPELTFKVMDPAGMALDLEGVTTPGPISSLFTLAYIPAGEEVYVAYTTRMATADDGYSVEQAAYDSGGVYTTIELGTYHYKFATVLPEDYDQDATTTLGVQSRRNLEEWDLGEYVVNEIYHFVPSGASEPMPRSQVTTATCNGCHDPLSLHGGWRTEIEVCVLCHNPSQGIDPDTRDSVDMPYMTHKIHAGAHLENGYTIIGYRGSVHDYSEVEFTADLNECEICHTGGTATEDFPLVANPNPSLVCDGSKVAISELTWGYSGLVEIRVNAADGPLFALSGSADSKMTGEWVQDDTVFFVVDADSGNVLQEVPMSNTVLGCANNPPGVSQGVAAVDHTVWMTNANIAACGSCHDDIDFEAGEGHPAVSVDSCGVCHGPTGDEYGASVAGAHQVDYKSSQLDGFLVNIVSIEDTDPGDSPLVTFEMKNKFGNVDPSNINRLRFSISGPNDDFSFYVSETATDAITRFGSNWRYRFSAKLPNDAVGSYSLGVEGRLNGMVNGESMRDQMQNFIMPFAVTGTDVIDRRVVVDDAKCESCHNNVSLHGGNRHDAGAYCQTCHNPSLTDEDERPADAGVPQSADFRYMIHKIHRGAALDKGYVVYGHNGSLNDFSDIHYVGDLRNCEACHVNDSYTLPLPAGTLPVTTPRDSWTPMLPETASCLSCHDSDGAAAHADANTGSVGEACATCHGTGKTYSVEAVHAR
jgi:hypothetical protein